MTANEEWFEEVDDSEDEDIGIIEYDIVASPNDFNVRTLFDFIDHAHAPQSLDLEARFSSGQGGGRYRQAARAACHPNGTPT